VLTHTTVTRHMNGTTSIVEFNESKSLLTCEETRVVITLLIEYANRAFPLSHKRLTEHVNMLLRACLGSSFKPIGKHWAQRFVARHSRELEVVTSRTLKSKRGRAVNEQTNAAWWSLYKKTVSERGITEDTLLAADETFFSSSHAGRERVITVRGRKVQHQTRGGDREHITVLVTIMANGKSLAPAIIFKGDHYLTSWKQDNPLQAS
jgi:hypothetical protein